MFSSLAEYAKAVPSEVMKLVSKRQHVGAGFTRLKLFSLHTCSLKLVLSDSELDKSLSKYSSNLPPKYYI